MTSTQAKDVGSSLIQLLTQQRLLYRQLRELAQKQSALVDGSNPEMLLRVLASRQRIIDRLSAIDRGLKPIRDQWQHIAGGLPASQRQQAQQLVAEVQEILGDIIARDEKDTQALSSHQQKVGAEIRSAAAGKRMHQAYGQQVASKPSRFLDTLSQ
ncbi:MAG: hypothetical protein JW810_12145 [Sedimentisphaerales bacterium]|nr:hypothetical protein [Sedimentisphaerales bacterium]